MVQKPNTFTNFLYRELAACKQSLGSLCPTFFQFNFEACTICPEGAFQTPGVLRKQLGKPVQSGRLLVEMQFQQIAGLLKKIIATCEVFREVLALPTSVSKQQPVRWELVRLPI
ncbi:MAG: hypothetical protein ABJG38_04390 [Nitratireductor sp.]